MGVLIVGTGALACLFAARLAGSGNEVTMLGSWPEGLAALRQHGVRLLEMDGSTHQYPVEVMDADSCHGTFTQALVLVKSWQTERVARQLEHCLDGSGIALTLQNGFGNVETLQAVLGSARVALGVTTIGARMLEPGYVQHTGEGKVSLGAHKNVTGFGELLKNAGFQVETDCRPPIPAVGQAGDQCRHQPPHCLCCGCPNGELLARPSARELMQEAATEAALVAAAKGIRLPYDDPEDAVEAVAKNTASNISSMLQDVLRGTPTEIDAINGAIIREGEKVGLLAPVNRILWRLVRGLDRN